MRDGKKLSVVVHESRGRNLEQDSGILGHGTHFQESSRILDLPKGVFQGFWSDQERGQTVIHQPGDSSKEICEFHPECLDQEMDLLSHLYHDRSSLGLLDEFNLFDLATILILHKTRDAVDPQVVVQQFFHQELLVLLNPLAIFIELVELGGVED